MVIDSSAILGILFDEPQADALEEAVAADAVLLVSAANVLETSIVVESRLGEAGGRELDLLLHATAAEVVSVDAEQVELARDAWRRFGKGRHPAGLDFGDCFAHALSRMSAEPLLCLGDDFPKTDAVLVPL